MTPSQLFAELAAARLMVVATTDGETPEAAVVAFSFDAKLHEIYFATETDTRKYQNLVKNPKIALVVGWESWTAQLSGSATILEGEERQRVMQAHVERNPPSAKYAKLPSLVCVRVKLLQATFTDFRAGEVIREVENLAR